MPAVHETVDQVRRIDVDQYKYGFETTVESEKAPKGLSEDTIRFISEKKTEPQWMLEWRLEAYRRWLTMDEPKWAKVEYPKINYQDINVFHPADRNPRQIHLDERHLHRALPPAVAFDDRSLEGLLKSLSKPDIGRGRRHAETTYDYCCRLADG